MRDLIVLMRFQDSCRRKVVEWVRDEWAKYADKKKDLVWGNIQNDRETISGGLRQDGFWYNQVLQYWGRAEAVGLDTPAGRQAVLKSVTTMIDAAASILRVYGEAPLPGYTSGEIHHIGDGCESHE